MRKSSIVLIVGILIIALSGCDFITPGQQISSVTDATVTPSKTAPPTFTRAPSMTPTPEDTATLQPLPTLPIVRTPTKKPAATTAPKPAATKAPTARPPTALPSFPVTFNKAYFCDQSNDPLWEVIGRINRSSPPAIFLGGYGLAVLSMDGKVLGVHQADPDGQQVSMWDFNCAVSGWYSYNVKYDVSEFRAQVPLILRIVRSKTDLTPLSRDYKADFAKPGRYFVEYSAAQ